MASRSISIGAATIVASLVTGIFGYLAAKQVLRVEVSLPDRREETFTIKAASNKIEDLSRKLALAEEEVASLQRRVSGEAGSGDLLKRIDTLEEQIERKDRLIADLRQKQEHLTDNKSPPTPAASAESRDRPRSNFRTRWFQMQVISVETAPEEIVLLAELKGVRDEAVDFHLDSNDTFVLDHQGNRWGGYAKVEDTLGVFSSPPVELLPGTTVRSRIRFEADARRSARLPNPKPPFTLIAEETSNQERIVIEGLEPQ